MAGEMIKLIDHIQGAHGGNKAAFARSIGIDPNNVKKLLNAKKPYYWHGGALYQLSYTEIKRG